MKFRRRPRHPSFDAGAPPEPGPEERGTFFDAATQSRLESCGRGEPGPSVTPKSALTLIAYYAALNVLATDLACLPLKVYRKRKSGGRDEVSDDVRSDLLAVSPDGETTSMRWRQAWYGHTFGHGNGYTEIEFAGGEVSGLYLLDPATEPDRRSQDRKLYYRLDDGSTRPPYKVLHLAGFGYDGLSGYSPARLARQGISLGLSAETFGATFFANGLNVRGVFEFPRKLGKEARDNFRGDVQRMHSGAKNAHGFMVLEDGVKWIQTSISPDDAQFLATRQFQVVEICRMFRLPPSKLMDFSAGTFNNVEAANIDYMTTTLMPWCEAIEQELNRKLFTREERLAGLYVEHQMQAFLRGDMNSRATFYERLFGLAVLTPNMIADRENLNPIGPEGDERFLTVQAVPLKVALNPPKQPAQASPEPSPDPAGDDPAEENPPINGARFVVARNGHG
jgi:HK97 family phage portal protein